MRKSFDARAHVEGARRWAGEARDEYARRAGRAREAPRSAHAYFEANKDVLDDDAKRRLYTNPLRILDTKNPDMQALVERRRSCSTTSATSSRAFLNRLEELVSAAALNTRSILGLFAVWTITTTPFSNGSRTSSARRHDLRRRPLRSARRNAGREARARRRLRMGSSA